MGQQHLPAPLGALLVLLPCLAGTACAALNEVRSLSAVEEVATMQNDIKKAWQQRDEALAQVAEMQKALLKKCGQEEAQRAAQAAKIAAKKAAAAKADKQVKQDRLEAKRQAEVANLAMSKARDAATKKHEVQDELKHAKIQLAEARGRAQAAKKEAATDKDAANKLSAAGGKGVEGAFAKASSQYSQAMDAKVKAEEQEKRVQGLQRQSDTATAAAEAKLRLAKEDTAKAADDVTKSLKAQAESASRGQRVALEQAKIVQEEEKELMQKSDHLKTKLAAAKIKTQQALAAVEAAKASEKQSLEAAQLPKSSSPTEQAEYNKAKAELASVSTKGDAPASYASTIKNIEAKLLKSQTDVETANRDKDKLSQELSDVKGRVMNEKDMIEKDKLKKKEQALEGQVLEAESRAKKAWETHLKEKKMQSQAIKEVITNVALEQEDEAKSPDESAESDDDGSNE